MKLRDFEKKKAEKWSEYDTQLQRLESIRSNDDVDVENLPKMIRERCIELSIARHRMYGESVCEYLNQQVIRGHKLLAHSKGGYAERIVRFFCRDFPKVMRSEWRLHLVCWLFFILPLVGMMASVHANLDWVRSILGGAGMADMDAMYGRGDEANLDMRDEAGADFMMFCHYVHNNIGIDFQIIAGGVLAGVGSLFILLMNGLGIGAAMAYVLEHGDPVKFFSFVSSHAPYELTGMVVAGMAGMRIGMGILNPGRMSRRRALLESGRRGLPMVYGAFFLTFVAACVEGFWSANHFAPVVNYLVGGAGWLVLVLYFALVGRSRGEA